MICFKRLLLLVFLFLSLPVWAGLEHDAEKLFKEGKFAEAAQKYAEALNQEKDPSARLNLQYNKGTALYRAKQYDEAAQELKTVALKGIGLDSLIGLKAWYNLGNTHFRSAMAKQDLPAKISGLKEAVVAYKQAIIKGNQEPKVAENLEFAQLKLKEAIDQQKQNQDQQDQQNDQDQPQPSEEAKRIFAQAKSLVAQGLYTDAQGLLKDLIERDETAQNYKSHLQRIEDLIDISQGRRPTRSFDHSNTDNELEVL